MPSALPDHRRRARALSALFAAHLGGFGIQLPFFPVWLNAKGFDPFWIGLILAVPILTRTIVTGPLTALADTRLGPVRLLAICDGLACLAFAGLFFAGDSALAIVLLVGIAALGQAPSVPLCDLIALAAIRADPRLNYGHVRIAGSAVFIVATLGGGLALGVVPIDAIVVALSLAAAFACASAFLQDHPRLQPASVPDDGQPVPAPATRILAFTVLGAGLVQASHGFLYGFASLEWQSRGFSGSVIGALWALGVAAEIVLFAVLGRHVGSARAGLVLLMAGAALAAIRFTAMAFQPGPISASLLQLLHAGSFGATHLGAMAVLSQLAPDGARGRWQGWLAGLTALGMALSTFSSGSLFAAYGGAGFAAMAPLALAGLVLAVLARRAYANGT